MAADETPITSEEVEDLGGRIAALEAERDGYLNDLKRVAADFENYRKRGLRDQQGLVARANERLLKELLPVLDDLRRAAQPPVRASGQEEGARGKRVEVPPAGATEADYQALIEGVELVGRSLSQALAREGLEEIETNGHFDPHVHEALLAQPSEEEEGSIVQVLQKGYRLGDRVLRPARVVVASRPAAEQPPGAQAEEVDAGG